MIRTYQRIVACFIVGLTCLELTCADTPLDTDLAAFLQQHCSACHTGESAKGNLDLESYSSDFPDAEIRRRWVFLLDRVADGEMPPESADQPDASSRTKFVTQLGNLLHRADLADREVILRRLNRNEYTNTVSDMFGIHVDVSRVLTDDSTENGFDNTGSTLSVSAEQLTQYVDAADQVLDQVFGPSRKPRTLDRTVNFATLSRGADSSERKLSDGVVLYSGAKFLPLYDASVPEPGLYKVRMQIRAEQSESPVVMHVKGGNTGQIAAHSVGFFEAPPGKITTVAFTDRAVERSDCFAIGLVGGYPYWKVEPDKYEGPGLFIGDISIEGPVDEWTESRLRLFGEIDPAVGTISDIHVILLKTLRRGFRRAVDEDEVAPYVVLAKQELEQGKSFEQALRVGLKGVLCAPEFLYLEESLDDAADKPTVNDDALASRLSYFLWSSLPDDELLTLAERGELKRPDVLRAQLDRMLVDPRSQRFVDNFTGQWLRVRDIDFTVPDGRLYPEYNELLRASMIDETRAFFREILAHNLSVQNFIDSDFVMINQPLAEFYGIDNVKGLNIRRVARPEGSVRGGVLTQASVLKVSADGTRTSPVLRGAWILNHLFGTPSPPPPPSAAAVEPDVRGASTIRDELAKHRSDQSCNRCHRKIDPPGFALESFDVLGAQRDWYRTFGQGGKYVKRQLHPFAPTTVRYQQGSDVDPSGVMPDGRKFADVREYKRLLRDDETAMARSLTRLLLSYSLGRQVEFSDRPEVERILTRVKADNYGLRSIIDEIVMSETFRSP
ncbi:MAG: DUF1592 domain-containing protein [Rhodopirellula sp.]|nr:DUF1592 domain-containing protein [Rhodopirellula sp.]